MPLLPGTAPALVGRAAPLAALAEHARLCRTERSGALLLAGDAGIGKTRLVAEFARTQGSVLVGGCLELGVDGLAYAPFTAALRQLLRESGPEPFAVGEQAGELARLLPELGPVPEGGHRDRGVLFGLVLHVLRTAAGTDGLTLVLEDLHWADGATRDLLVFLIRNLELPGVQIIATYRSDDLHRAHPLRRLLPELERLPSVTRLDLEPLSRAEVDEHVRALTGRARTPAELDDLYRRSDGIPLYVEALAAAGPHRPGGVPDAFRDLLLAPVDRLDDTALSVLRLSAVGAVSGTVSHEALRRVCDLGDRDLEIALHTLIDGRLLHVDGEGYRFRHALLREAVHESLLPGTRTRLHLRFAEAVREHPGTVPGERRAAELAHHFQAAHDLPRAVSAAWDAAERAGESLAHGERLAMLRRVLELWDRVPGVSGLLGGRGRPEVLAEAALAALEGGHPRTAWELCDEALAGLPAESADDSGRALRAKVLRCRGQARTHCVDAGAEHDLAEALRLHPPHMPGYARMLSILARETMFRTEGAGPLDRSSEELAREAIAAAERSGDDSALAAALVTLGSVLMGRGLQDLGRPHLERSIELSRRIGDPMMEARGVNNLSHYLREQGHHARALELLEAFLAAPGRRDSGWVHGGFTSQNLAELHYETGDLAGARAIAARALGHSPSPMHRVFLLVPAARAAIAQGDLAAARSGTARGELREAGIASLDRASVLSLERLDQAQQAASAWLDLLLAEGDAETARTYAVQILERPGFTGSAGYGWVVAELAAEAVRRTGAGPGDPAHALVSGLLDMPARGPVQEAFRAATAARLAEGTAGPREVLERWAAAVAAWESTPMVLHLAAARLRAALAALAVRDQARARAWWEPVGPAAAASGAVPMEREAAALGRRAGFTAPDRAAPAGLTPREVEVLRLLAAGSTNAQIAAELFISPKTASVHVSNILAKLDAPNRASAGARARDLGLA
ncbi:ATP-binding protein [Nocardiopsis dassonvillei]|uniref:ATP-binding protein n=1 Tax=Nocardiopsis dassonvillei TaxID=2014 RepID=UPI003F5511D6